MRAGMQDSAPVHQGETREGQVKYYDRREQIEKNEANGLLQNGRR